MPTRRRAPTGIRSAPADRGLADRRAGRRRGQRPREERPRRARREAATGDGGTRGDRTLGSSPAAAGAAVVAVPNPAAIARPCRPVRRRARRILADDDRRPASATWGAQSMTAPLREVLVKAPGPAFGPPSTTSRTASCDRVDLEAARREHDGLVDTLTGSGAASTSSTWRPTTRTSSTCSTRCSSRTAARSRCARASRTGPASPTSSRRGPAPVASRRSGRIEAPGTLEGGDTFWLRPDLLCVGRTLRTNDAGARQLAAIVGGDVRVFDVPYWKGPAELVHLLSVDLARRRRRRGRVPAAAARRAVRAARATSASAWSRCPRRSTRRSAATSSPSGRASSSTAEGNDVTRRAARGRGRARSTRSRCARSARTGRAA